MYLNVLGTTAANPRPKHPYTTLSFFGLLSVFFALAPLRWPGGLETLFKLLVSIHIVFVTISQIGIALSGPTT